MADLDILERIRNIYDTCTPQEQEYLQQILKEISETGESSTYQNIWLADYKEIPVDIDTFITSDRYMGLTNQQGKTVYPFWRKTMREIFNAGNKYEEVVFTGATRIGKTSTAILCVAYMLYRLMCLQDPQRYFGKKDISKFSIMFFNITKDLAKGVAYREFNDSLRMSPWFNDRGTFSKSERDFYYVPEGDKIVIDFGSDAAHGLGKQVFCVVGNTTIYTDKGIMNIEQASELSDVRVLTYSSDGGLYYVYPEDIIHTKDVNKTIQIELDNGVVIEGTPEHEIMLSDGTYKRLCDITMDDDIKIVDLGGVH